MSLAAGQKYKGVADDGCAKCMFNCFSCGTDFTFVVQKVDGDGVTFHKYTYCFGLCYGSPCPCLSCCCCDGPHVQYPRFKKESDVRFVADGTQSVWKGDCCAGACHNHGDVIEVKDGKLWWQPGDSNVVPPCFKGKQDIAYMTVVKGAPPTNATMER